MDHSITFIRDWRITIGTLATALALVSAAVAVRPARADEHHERHLRAHVQRHYRHGNRQHRGVYYAPAPDVYYAPPPVVYAPPPPPGGLRFIFPFNIR